MMTFKDLSIWFIGNFMKMPQLSRKYPIGAAKRRKKEERIKLTKNVKVSSTDLVLVSLQRRVQLQAPKLLIVTISV